MRKHLKALTAVAAMAWASGCGQQDPVSSLSGGSDTPAAKLVVTGNKVSGSRERLSTFSAVITPGQENPGVNAAGSGTGTFTLIQNADKTQLRFSITVSGFGGAPTAAHFHNAAAGINGGVVRTLPAKTPSSQGDGVWLYSGTWSSSDATQPLTPALLKELEAGNLYVNFHTAANPGGELRGQVKPL